MTYTITVYVTDRRPVPPVWEAYVNGTLQDAKDTVDERVTAQPDAFSDWKEAHGQWFREGQHFGYLISEGLQN